MSDLLLFAVDGDEARPLPLPAGAVGFENLYDGLVPGVYSALRTFSHHRFLCLEDHLGRTKRSITLLGWDYQLDESGLRHALHQACMASPWPDARVRIDVLSEPAWSLGSESRVLIALKPFASLSPQIYEKGVAVGLAPELSRRRPLVKAADFAHKRYRYAADHPRPVVYEYLMLSESGAILEGTGSSFYAVRDGIAYTAADGVLEGVTRKIILSLLPELDIPLRLEAIHTDDIGVLDEAGMSSSSRALLPIVEIEGQTVGTGRPGPICRRILVAYNEFVARNIKPAISQ
jgi:branched-subunit amino acid aminotransferase/4-amino-4-deoxychorismate lyase